MRRTIRVALVIAAAALVLGLLPSCGSEPTDVARSPTPPAGTAFPGSNGKIVFASGNGDIFLINADGTEKTNLTNSEGLLEGSPAWSPDGMRIAFTTVCYKACDKLLRRPGDQDIFVMNVDGQIVQLTDTSGRDESDPAWSPDGTQIAYSVLSPESGAGDIFVMNADGSGQTRITRHPLQPQWDPAWSPDGTLIAFSWGSIHTMAPDGTWVTDLTGNPTLETDPAWSPDGTKIVFSRAVMPKAKDDFSFASGNVPSGWDALYVMRANGRGVKALIGTRLGESPAWSPDGTKIVYEHAGSIFASCRVMNADGTGARRLVGAFLKDCNDPDW